MQWPGVATPWQVIGASSAGDSRSMDLGAPPVRQPFTALRDGPPKALGRVERDGCTNHQATSGKARGLSEVQRHAAQGTVARRHRIASLHRQRHGAGTSGHELPGLEADAQPAQFVH